MLHFLPSVLFERGEGESAGRSQGNTWHMGIGKVPVNNMQPMPTPPLEAFFIHQRFLRVFCSESAVEYENNIEIYFFLKIL